MGAIPLKAQAAVDIDMAELQIPKYDDVYLLDDPGVPYPCFLY